MKKLRLIHSHTPPSVIPVSEQIEALFAEEELDTERFMVLVNQRDLLLKAYLAQPDFDPAKHKDFLKNEILANDLLVRVARENLTASQKQLINLVRGRKAFQKYT